MGCVRPAMNVHDESLDPESGWDDFLGCRADVNIEMTDWMDSRIYQLTNPQVIILPGVLVCNDTYRLASWAGEWRWLVVTTSRFDALFFSSISGNMDAMYTMPQMRNRISFTNPRNVYSGRRIN